MGGDLSAEDDAAQVLADALSTAWERVLHPDEIVVDRLRAVERHYGVSVLPEDFTLGRQGTLDEMLVPGARVCFTGEVVSDVHGVMGRDRMERLAEQRGLRAVATVTKTKTDVLVVAELGTQSNKTKNAVEVGQARDRGRGLPGLAGQR